MLGHLAFRRRKSGHSALLPGAILWPLESGPALLCTYPQRWYSIWHRAALYTLLLLQAVIEQDAGSVLASAYYIWVHCSQRLQGPNNRQYRKFIIITICKGYFYLFFFVCVKMTHFLKCAAEPQRGEGQRDIVSVFGHPQQQALLYFSHVLYSPTLQWLMRFKWKACSERIEWLELEAAVLRPFKWLYNVLLCIRGKI